MLRLGKPRKKSAHSVARFVVVHLRWQASQEAVAGILSVAARADISEDAADEGAAVENERKSDEAGLVVVLAERPPCEAHHATTSAPHEVGGDHIFPDRFLSPPADVHRRIVAFGIEFLGEHCPLIAAIQLAVMDVEHGC